MARDQAIELPWTNRAPPLNAAPSHQPSDTRAKRHPAFMERWVKPRTQDLYERIAEVPKYRGGGGVGVPQCRQR